MKRILFVLAAVLVISACGNDNKTVAPVVTKEAAPTISESPTPSPIASVEPTRAFDWASAEVTEENVRKALERNVGAAMAITVKDETFRKFAITYDTKGAYVELTVNPGMFANEKDFVKRAGGSLIAYSKILFSNPEVYEVSVNALIDNVGGGENKGAYISWRREQAEDVDYDSVLDNMFGDYTIPYQLARKYSIQTDLYGELKDFGLPRESNM